MKSIVLSIALSITAVLAFSQTVQIMSFNIRDVTLNDQSPHDWTSRLPRCVSVINSSQPDFIGLQEATGSQIGALLSSLPNFTLAGGGTHTVLFYDNTKFKELSNGVFWLSETPEISGSIGWDAIYERVCVYSIFENLSTGEKIYGYNTHLSHVGSQAKYESCKLIAQRIADRSQPEIPFFLTGDFNSAEDEAPTQYLLNDNSSPIKFRDSYRDIHPNETQSGTIHGYSGSTDWNKIDYVFCEDGKFTTSSASIIHYNENGNYPSDHYPVESTVEFLAPTNPTLSASPSALETLMPHGQSDLSSSASISISNIGIGNLPALSAKSSQDWIDLSFDTQIGNTRTLTIDINASADLLSAGTHSAVITISGNGIESKTVTYQLIVHTGCLTNNGFESNGNNLLPSDNAFEHSQSNDLWTISTAGHDEWDGINYNLNDGAAAKSFDLTQEGVVPILKIRAKSSAPAYMRLTLKDASGTTAQNGTLNGMNGFELTDQFQEFSVDFTGQLWDEYTGGGNLSQTQVSQIYITVNPGWVTWPITGSNYTYDNFFSGTIDIDYISLGAGCTHSPLTSNKEKTHQHKVTLFPNPAYSEVRFSEEYNHVSVINSMGQTVLVSNSPSNELDISLVPPGMYLLLFSKGNTSDILDLVIK